MTPGRARGREPTQAPPTIPWVSASADIQTADSPAAATQAAGALAAQKGDVLAETGMRAEGECLPASVVYDERGLVPCVVQDWGTGEVLMLAYMNEEALARTRDTGELHLWSRSRGELWHKGATSGNTQAVRALRVDCDGDTVLALVEPAGPACHTGERTCFHRGERPQGGQRPLAPHETLPALERTLAERAHERPAGSYTVALLEDPPRIGEKVREEAEEVARAAREESDERVDEEAADVLYHLLVLLHSRGRALADAERVLDARRR
jgi:phosphoribosyl-ATP pyrophosphohydrolase/phosphoribosyl-AMP cyclohydrolase